MTPNYEIVSAPPGKPSILWLGKSGRKYRTLVAAKIDKIDNAYITETVTALKDSVTSNSSSFVFVILFVVVVVAFYKLIK